LYLIKEADLAAELLALNGNIAWKAQMYMLFFTQKPIFLILNRQWQRWRISTY
jgi:hypothetical protein